MAYHAVNPRLLTVSAQTANGTVSIPAGYRIDSIDIQETAGNAITGGIRIGTTNGGVEVAVAIAVAGSALVSVTDAAILKRFFSASVATTLYIQTVTLWNSASVNIQFVLSRIL